MSRSQKPRKAYRPRVVSRTAGLDVIERRTPMDINQTTDLGIAYHVALDEMIRGRGTEEHWSTVVCALNIALVLAEMGFAALEIMIIKDALDGAVRTRDRARQIGRWGFDGDALLDVKMALETHDSQMAIVPKSTIIAALAEVHRRIDSGHAFREAA
ncbi:hypothetical protein [Paraburkholderia sp. BCC1884]|uniref:hypothetical protein n=1 Tax=Paraburkholderia sp. BCC1884 TaxID=2562668 RepID=UPI001182EF47|nr:hypothetical protein [Paraburkholderia sp. BCC1884]